MSSYNVHDAKSNLSGSLRRAAAGEEVIITQDGQPVAELIPYRALSRKRQLGFAAGQIEVAEGWDLPMTDAEAEAFLGGRL